MQTQKYYLEPQQYGELDKKKRQEYIELNMEKGLSNMTESELKEFSKQYKDFYLPKHRLYATIPYNIVVCGVCMYYTMNIKKIANKFFKPKKFGFKELLYYGTIQSTIFVATYTLGTMAVTGLWNPIEYGRGVAKIQGQIIDMSVRHDKKAQKYFLYNFMEYFGLSQDVLKHAQEDLEKQKQDLLDKNFFTKETQKILRKSEGNYDGDSEDEEDDEEEQK